VLVWEVKDPTFGEASTWLSAPAAVGLLRAQVERCRLTLSKPELKARLVSALESRMW